MQQMDERMQVSKARNTSIRVLPGGAFKRGGPAVQIVSTLMGTKGLIVPSGGPVTNLIGWGLGA